MTTPVRPTAKPFVPEVLHRIDPTSGLSCCFDPARRTFSVYNSNTHEWVIQDPVQGPDFVFDQALDDWIFKPVFLERQRQRQRQRQKQSQLHFTQMQSQGAGAGSVASARSRENGFAKEAAQIRALFFQIRNLTNQIRLDRDDGLKWHQDSRGREKSLLKKISTRIETLHSHLSERQEQLEAKIARIEELSAGIDALEESIGSLKANVETKEAALAALNERMGSLEERITSLNGQVDDQVREITDLQHRVNGLETKMTAMVILHKRESTQISKLQQQIRKLNEDFELTEAQANVASERALRAEAEAKKSSSQLDLLREKLENIRGESLARVQEISVTVKTNLDQMIRRIVWENLQRFEITPLTPEQRTRLDGAGAAGGAGSI